MTYFKVGKTWERVVKYKVVADREGTMKCEECAIKFTCTDTNDKPNCLKERREDKIDVHFEEIFDD